MNEADRVALYTVLNAYKTLADLLSRSLRERPNDVGFLEARAQLEPAFQLRVYAVFESILANRAVGTGIATYVQWEVGESTAPDPIPPHRDIPWWKLLQRDRNRLAHGNLVPPALSLSNTVRLFESYLAMRTERNP